MAFLRRAVLALALAVTLAACGGGGEDVDCCTPPGASTPTTDELAWIQDVCAILEPAWAHERDLPGYVADTAVMDLAQLAAWAEGYWPDRLEIHQRLVIDLAEIPTPSPRVSKIHDAIVERSLSISAELDTAVKNFETEFSSIETARQRMGTIEAAEDVADAAVEDAFRAPPEVLHLETAYEECTGAEF